MHFGYTFLIADSLDETIYGTTILHIMTLNAFFFFRPCTEDCLLKVENWKALHGTAVGRRCKASSQVWLLFVKTISVVEVPSKSNILHNV